MSKKKIDIKLDEKKSQKGKKESFIKNIDFNNLIISIAYALIAVLIFTAAKTNIDNKISNSNTYDTAIKSHNFFDAQDLIYDENTKIIYIKSKTYFYYVYLPYYSENGKFCRYIDGEIVEVNDIKQE